MAEEIHDLHDRLNLIKVCNCSMLFIGLLFFHVFPGHSFLAWRVFTGSDRRALWAQQKVQVGIAGERVIGKNAYPAPISPRNPLEVT